MWEILLLFPLKRPEVAAPPRHVPQKIALRQTYPCPCCHQGQLGLITLTEALGCNHCHHIFAVLPNHLQIEQLGVLNLYRRIWSWDGRQWIPDQGGKPKEYPYRIWVGLGVLLVAGILFFSIPASRIVLVVIGGILLLLVFWIWRG